jgi:ATP-dependent RNA helicase SUPV3L1/SUV3
MPVSVDVEFLAVDEVQLMTHPVRGHVFVDRVLHARGTEETWFLGSASVRPLLEQLVPSARFTAQPRFSELRFAGASSLGRLPRRSAIVAFSGAEVYQLAERVRVRRGGAAVVLGALSPRTRNAQVALYQSGEVDYLVATDAIGMGLNMSIDHVALAGLTKFDGRASRPLDIAEMAQVAGRAGRYLSNGSFGTLDPGPRLSFTVAERIETHRIPLDHQAWWRNATLDFTSVDALKHSLMQKPPLACLRLVQSAEDSLALDLAILRPKVKQLATSEARVRLLWDVCQIPDYRKLLPEVHCDLVVSIYEELLRNNGALDEAWLSRQLESLNDVTGDIDALLGRISFVRTWTYVVNHRQWVIRGRHFRERATALEDALSDALHERLMQRFVERRRRSVVLPQLLEGATIGSAGVTPKDSKQKQPTPSQVHPNTPFSLPADHPFAKLESLRARLVQPRSTLVAAGAEPPSAGSFWLSPAGILSREGTLVARLVAGKSVLVPELRWLHAESDAAKRTLLEKAAREHLLQLVSSVLPVDPEDGESNNSSLRGLWYQLRGGLGTVPRPQVQPLLSALSPKEVQSLERRGVYLGRAHVYLKALLRPHAIRLRVSLASAFFGEQLLPSRLDPRSVSLPRMRDYAAPACLVAGYACVGPRVVRVDILDRLLLQCSELGSDTRETRLALARRSASLLGCRQNEVPQVLGACQSLLATPVPN